LAAVASPTTSPDSFPALPLTKYTNLAVTEGYMLTNGALAENTYADGRCLLHATLRQTPELHGMTVPQLARKLFV
jgi:hypothetical protein